MDQNLNSRVGLEQRLKIANVVVVMMGQQDVSRRHLMARRGLDQRRDRAASINEEGRAIRFADEVGVSQEVG